MVKERILITSTSCSTTTPTWPQSTGVSTALRGISVRHSPTEHTGVGERFVVAAATAVAAAVAVAAAAAAAAVAAAAGEGGGGGGGGGYLVVVVVVVLLLV